MQITLTVVVAAIVILITALVVITVFGSGVSNVGGIARAKAQCESEAAITCKATDSLPITWGIENMRLDSGGLTSCERETGIHYCRDLPGYAGSGSDSGANAGGERDINDDTYDFGAVPLRGDDK